MMFFIYCTDFCVVHKRYTYNEPVEQLPMIFQAHAVIQCSGTEKGCRPKLGFMAVLRMCFQCPKCGTFKHLRLWKI